MFPQVFDSAGVLSGGFVLGRFGNDGLKLGGAW